MIKTHWGRVTHICVGKLAIIGSNNGLSPGRRQAIIWTNAAILLIGPLGTNFSEILNELQTFSLKKILLKMSSAKCCPFRLGLNVLRTFWLWHTQEQLLVNTYRILSSLFYRIGINKMHCYLYKRWEIIFFILIYELFNCSAAIYVCIVMCQLTVSLIITACLLNLYHHRPDVPPPAWLRRLVNGCLAPLLCINCGKGSKCRRKSRKDRYDPYSENQSRSVTLTQNHSSSLQEITLPEYIHTYVIKRSEHIGSCSIEDFNKREWQNIARILDRLFFMIFTIFNIFISVVMLISLNHIHSA